VSFSPAEAQSAFRRLIRQPFFTYLLLILGLATAGIYSTIVRDDFQIVKGAEMALLAITRFIILGQLIEFFRGLMILGLGTPLVMGLSSPLFYYSRQLRLEPFLETFGIGLLPGLGLFFLGWKGLQLHRRNQQAGPGAEPETAADGFCARWLPTVEQACEWSIWIMIATLMSGEWSGIGVLAVGFAGLTLAFSLVILVGAKTSIGRRGIGISLVIAGLVTILTSIVLVTTQGNRCTEAVLGIPPGILLVIIGLALWLGASSRHARVS